MAPPGEGFLHQTRTAKIITENYRTTHERTHKWNGEAFVPIVFAGLLEPKCLIEVKGHQRTMGTMGCTCTVQAKCGRTSNLSQEVMQKMFCRRTEELGHHPNIRKT